MKKLILCISVLSLVTSNAFAGRASQADIDQQIERYKSTTVEQPVTPAGMDVIPTSQAPTGVTGRNRYGRTIQDAATESRDKTAGGEKLGYIAMGVTGFGVASTCFTGGGITEPCGWWIAGLAASTVVASGMLDAKDQSNRTIAAVTGANGGTAGQGADVRPSYNSSPEIQQGQALLSRVRGLGVDVDMKTGNVTDPKGKVYNASMLGNPAAMQAAGHSPSSFAGANAVKKALDGAIKSATAADGSSMFGDTVGAAGGAAAAKGVEGGGLQAGMTAGFQNPTLGEDRGPAQVAGLAKNLDGTPIGISQDNLFTMIGKRYQWCSTKGCFLPTTKP